MLQEFRYRLLAAGTALRDLLDAQGLAWWLVSAYPPKGWTGDDLAALEVFGRGAPADPRRRSQPPASGLFPDIDTELAAKLHLPSAWLGGLLDMLEDKKQLIFYGRPGTGKTYVALKLGEHIAARRRRSRLVQFHPSYTYEDFFEGYRPVDSDDGAVKLRARAGARCGEIADRGAANPTRRIC